MFLHAILIPIATWAPWIITRHRHTRCHLWGISGILYISVSALLFNGVHDDGYDWFDYVKRASLIVAYLSKVLMYCLPGKVTTTIYQWVLTINVLEAGILGVVANDFVCGVLLIILTPFSPKFSVKEGMWIAESGHIFLLHPYISAQNYIRFYLSVLFTYSIFGVHFIEKEVNIFAGISCLVPLILNEIEPEYRIL